MAQTYICAVQIKDITLLSCKNPRSKRHTNNKCYGSLGNSQCGIKKQQQINKKSNKTSGIVLSGKQRATLRYKVAFVCCCCYVLQQQQQQHTQSSSTLGQSSPCVFVYASFATSSIQHINMQLFNSMVCTCVCVLCTCHIQ